MRPLMSLILTSLCIVAIGCDDGGSSQDIKPAAKPTIPKVKRATPAIPKVTGATLAKVVLPTGWSRTAPRDLPAVSRGYSEALTHVSEPITVTHYRYTRGIASIPDTVNSDIVRREFANSKKGIQKVVKLGYWRSAIETASKTVPLGESKTVAHWAQYEMTAPDGGKVLSQIFVWAQFGYFVKLRCTSRPDTPEAEKALRSLLTALGAKSRGR